MNNQYAIYQVENFLSRIKPDLDKQLVEAIQKTINLAHCANKLATSIKDVTKYEETK